MSRSDIKRKKKDLEQAYKHVAQFSSVANLFTRKLNIDGAREYSTNSFQSFIENEYLQVIDKA